MRLELSRRAQADLDDIRDYSVEQFGIERAIDYLDMIEHVFRRILDHPEIGTGRPDLGDRLRSLPAGEHRVFYSPERDYTLVIRVLHKMMDATRHVDVASSLP